jgi:hypothetical protein
MRLGCRKSEDNVGQLEGAGHALLISDSIELDSGRRTAAERAKMTRICQRPHESGGNP